MMIKEGSEIKIVKVHLDMASGSSDAKKRVFWIPHPSESYEHRGVATTPSSMVETARQLIFDCPQSAVGTQANASTAAVIMALNC